MTLYNKEKYVEKAIYSVLNQTFKNFQLVIVDDCSTDSSLKIAKFFKDKRIKIIQNKINVGCFYSRNVGMNLIKEHNFDFYTSHDADDYSDPFMFEKILSMFNSENTIAVIPRETRFGNNLTTFEGKDTISSIVPAHLFLSKKGFNLLGYYDNALSGADVDYFIRIKALCNNFSIFNYKESTEDLYFANMTENSMLLTYSDELREKYYYDKIDEVKKMSINNSFYRPFFQLEDSVKNKK
jgi:glycosyltransferase involved in cell wall biosynthesis